MKKRLQKHRHILMFLVIALSAVASIAGFQIANALRSPTIQEETVTVQKTPANSRPSSQEKEEAAKAEATEAEKKQTEAKAAQTAAATETAKTTSQQAVVGPRINVKSPAGRALYNDTASKAGYPAEIANQSTGIWLGGWTSNVQGYVHTVTSAAAASGTIPTFVVYNIPNRDCGSYSAGGANGSESYRAWIRSIAAGLGGREAIVILEPDALSQMNDCLSAAGQNQRYADIAYAVSIFATTTGAFIYLDAGNSSWIGAAEMANRLEKANVGQARGFSMNVSGFQSTASTIAYGERIGSKIKKQYVIDTSRNGQGANGGEWCNPRGRGLGKKPSIVTSGNLDAYLWIKIPGESDGECNGGPSAGTYWDDYAQELIRNAVY